MRPNEKLSQLDYAMVFAGRFVKSRDKDTKMFSTLFKLGFWGGLTLLFIPVDLGAQNEGRTVSAFEAIIAAKETVDDLRDICVRKPDVCETGGAALQTISARAKAGAKMVLEYVEDEPAKTPQPIPAKDLKS